jgi:hypothetical protein
MYYILITPWSKLRATLIKRRSADFETEQNTCYYLKFVVVDDDDYDNENYVSDEGYDDEDDNDDDKY